MQRATRLKWLMNCWPPYLFSGIRVLRIAADFSEVEVALRDRWLNRNYFGTHFGGSLFAMTDPFLALMLVHRLGPGYIVWDQSAAIVFCKPGRRTVRAKFSLSNTQLDEIRAEAASGNKVLPSFQVEVRDDAGDVVARVDKSLYVRRKRAAAEAPL